MMVAELIPERIAEAKVFQHCFLAHIVLVMPLVKVIAVARVELIVGLKVMAKV